LYWFVPQNGLSAIIQESTMSFWKVWIFELSESLAQPQIWKQFSS